MDSCSHVELIPPAQGRNHHGVGLTHIEIPNARTLISVGSTPRGFRIPGSQEFHQHNTDAVILRIDRINRDPPEIDGSGSLRFVRVTFSKDLRKGFLFGVSLRP